MTILAFECVARTASAGLWDGTREVAFADLAGGEAEKGLVPLLDRLIRDHGTPSALAVAAGPGSFTGLRIATVAARTLAWLEQIPVHPVDALAAIAAEQGDGCWWVLLPLKKDTTFHGLFTVQGGIVETHLGTMAALDAAIPATLAAHAGLLADATAIGPALAAKPGLAERWWPGIRVGSASALSARGVARIAAQVPAVAWDALLPAYHQEPAPVLQRRAGIS